MRRVAGVLGVLLFLASPLFAQEPTLVVENGRVIRGDGTVLEEASVVVSGDSILAVTRGSVDAPQARRIDATGKTVLPGLIDAHVHLTIPSDGRDSTALARHLHERVPGILEAFLTHGVTTIRSTGAYWPEIGRVRERVAAGEAAGPRIVTSGPIITAAGGHPAATICAGLFSGLDPDHIFPFCRSHLAREVSGPSQAREKVQGLSEGGVDFIKIVSDSALPSTLAPVQIETSTVRAIVDRAHREGLRVVGHVADPDHMLEYSRLGMDGFAHLPRPTALEDGEARRLAKVLAKRETPVTTTVSAILLYAPGGATDKVIETALDGSSRRGKYATEAAGHAAVLAKAGVPVVVGTDWCACLGVTHRAYRPGAGTVTEMQLLRRGGMSHHDIIQAATSRAARALEMEDRVGTLEPGKLADLIVVDGNPLEDLSALDSVDVVVQGGEIVSDPAGR